MNDSAKSNNLSHRFPLGKMMRPTSSPFIDTRDRLFWIGLITVALSLGSALATFLILTGLTPIVPRNETVIAVLFLNVLLIIALIGLIAWQSSAHVRAWREKLPGARLHTRIVLLFSIVAAVPAILLAIGATVSFSRSLDSWFSGRVQTIIRDSVEVAQTYLEEHGQVIRTDVVNMARDIDAASPEMKLNDETLRRLTISQAGLRELATAYIIDGDGKPIIKAIESKNLPYKKPTKAALNEADQGQIPLSMSVVDQRIVAISKFESIPDRYLYVSRPVSAAVIQYLQRTEQNAAEYTQIRRTRGGLKWAHALMYLTISMTALLAAIWAGMWFAGRFVAPISRLIGAAQQVSKGDLSVTLPERRGEGDLRRLSQNFNTMTRELGHQRDALVTANEQLLMRRRFMEAVLSGVSAGVIGLNSQEQITLVSRSAEKLLNVQEADLVGLDLSDALPEFAELLKQPAFSGATQGPPQQLTLNVEGEERTFALRITGQGSGEGDVGSVVTFDDISDLVLAQRTSAWADVARRIAHEIKNPLTPIILSVGRIRKNYGHLINEKRELFDNLTGTIERQAGDIKTMIDEFAAFARMPQPEMSTGDLRDAVREPVFLFREGHPNIKYDLDLPDHEVKCFFDRRLISQAVTNLVKNATEAIESVEENTDGKRQTSGHIKTRVRIEGDRVAIEVIDNGPGLPKQNRMQILEPYVTTKGHKGTGLGLAMVKKIAEQHHGALTMDDAATATKNPEAENDYNGSQAPTGALFRITLPLHMASKKEDPKPSKPRAKPRAKTAKPTRAPKTAAE